VKLIRRCVTRMLVLFGFEAEWYARHGVAAVHVGHPLVDEVPQLPQVWDRVEGIGASAGIKRVALLPGSRRSEVEALLPSMLASVEKLAQHEPIEVRLIRAPSLGSDFLEGLIQRAAITWPIEIVSEDRFEVVADSHLALCASGTATLEVGLLTTPMVVLYRLEPFSYWLARTLVDLPAFSLVNLVLEAPVVPELLQGEANPERIVEEALRLLNEPEARDRQRTGLRRVRECLGESGATERAAEEVSACLARLG
jgi:lipid-A-disaccharide synthase